MKKRECINLIYKIANFKPRNIDNLDENSDIYVIVTEYKSRHDINYIVSVGDSDGSIEKIEFSNPYDANQCAIKKSLSWKTTDLNLYKNGVDVWTKEGENI